MRTQISDGTAIILPVLEDNPTVLRIETRRMIMAGATEIVFDLIAAATIGPPLVMSIIDCHAEATAWGASFLLDASAEQLRLIGDLVSKCDEVTSSPSFESSIQ